MEEVAHRKTTTFFQMLLQHISIFSQEGGLTGMKNTIDQGRRVYGYKADRITNGNQKNLQRPLERNEVFYLILVYSQGGEESSNVSMVIEVHRLLSINCILPVAISAGNKHPSLMLTWYY